MCLKYSQSVVTNTSDGGHLPKEKNNFTGQKLIHIRLQRVTESKFG